MFPDRFFPTRFFNPRYWAKEGSTTVEQTGGGWEEAVDIYSSGWDSVSMFMAGADRADMFVPVAEAVEAT